MQMTDSEKHKGSNQRNKESRLVLNQWLMRGMSRRCGGLGGAAQVRAQRLYKGAQQRACWELEVCVCVCN